MYHFPLNIQLFPCHLHSNDFSVSRAFDHSTNQSVEAKLICMLTGWRKSSHQSNRHTHTHMGVDNGDFFEPVEWPNCTTLLNFRTHQKKSYGFDRINQTRSDGKKFQSLIFTKCESKVRVYATLKNTFAAKRYDFVFVFVNSRPLELSCTCAVCVRCHCLKFNPTNAENEEEKETLCGKRAKELLQHHHTCVTKEND